MLKTVNNKEINIQRRNKYFKKTLTDVAKLFTQFIVMIDGVTFL